MKLYVGLTDNDWFDAVANLPDIDGINFWQPTGRSKKFQVLQPGEPFLFKPRSPFNNISKNQHPSAGKLAGQHAIIQKMGFVWV